jgi:AraC family transcriptional regulator
LADAFRRNIGRTALQRVQVFIEANLAGDIHLRDLAARAQPYHFARAFKTSAGVTPRAFVEARRIARQAPAARDQRRNRARRTHTGLGTQSRLTSVFKHRTGFTLALYPRGGAS